MLILYVRHDPCVCVIYDTLMNLTCVIYTTIKLSPISVCNSNLFEVLCLLQTGKLASDIGSVLCCSLQKMEVVNKAQVNITLNLSPFETQHTLHHIPTHSNTFHQTAIYQAGVSVLL